MSARIVGGQRAPLATLARMIEALMAIGWVCLVADVAVVLIARWRERRERRIADAARSHVARDDGW